MTEKSTELLALLELEPIENNIFRGQNEARFGPRLFGGQVLAQALVAAARTVETERQCHSLHGYFMRPGDADIPVVYHVDRIRDGRSFTTRRIVAVQHGEAIFSMDASFQTAEQGLSHQVDMASMPMPEDLEDDREVAQRMDDGSQMSGWAKRERPFDFRSVYPADRERPEDNLNPVWIRFRQDLADKPQACHRFLLAYASDMGLVSTAMVPHRHSVRRDSVQMASLDHALWFHRDVVADDWIVYIKETTNANASRGFNRGAFYSKSGELVASSMQEGLMRVRDQGA